MVTSIRSRRVPLLSLLATAIVVAASAVSARAAPQRLEAMPPELETRFALSAAPPALRAAATVYLLDPAAGYRKSVRGTSGVECLVERTAWEHADFRDDIYVPLCYDAAGAKTYLQVIRDVATLRARGVAPATLRQTIERRYRSGQYRVPGPGVSYMIAPVMRTWMLPDLQVHTMPMPHVMFYAPNVTDRDLGARPGTSIAFPFIFQEGIPEQSYVIQVLGESETAQVLKEQATLLNDLCAHRSVLCWPAREMPREPAGAH